MGTRATIKFKDGYDEFYVYRGHDGYPENVLPDLQIAIDNFKQGNFGHAECSLLVTKFLGIHFDINKRCPYYEITGAFHGDESYRYSVEWDATTKEWVSSVI